MKSGAVVDVAIIPDNEPQRLAAVRRYDILDTPPDGAFDRITAIAARLFDVPISIVSVVDEDRIWFKSHHGLDVEQIGRDPGLCASAILGPDPWLVADAATDPRTLANPLVAGAFGLRFYAGIPLRTHDGYNLGTLCVIDREPREATGEQMATLQDLAAVVMDELELRLSARRTLHLETELRRQAETVASELQESLVPPALPEVDRLELASRYHVAQRDRVGGDFFDVVPFPGGAGLVVGDACGKGTPAAALAGIARWTLHTLMASGASGRRPRPPQRGAEPAARGQGAVRDGRRRRGAPHSGRRGGGRSCRRQPAAAAAAGRRHHGDGRRHRTDRRLGHPQRLPLGDRGPEPRRHAGVVHRRAARGGRRPRRDRRRGAA